METIHTELLRQIIRDELLDILSELNSRNSDNNLLSRAEAAEYLGVKPNTLAVWAHECRGPAPTKVGSRVFYRQSELDRSLDENTLPRRRASND